MKKAILFDIDGTLLDTKNYIFNAFNYALDSRGYKKTKKEIESVMGKTLEKCYELLVPSQDPQLFCPLHVEYQQNNYHLIKPFPNLKKVLKKIKTSNILIAAVTNRSKHTLHKSLKDVSVHEYFDVILAVEDVANPKPHPEHALTALKKLGVKPENAYMVGDTQTDILLGKNAGIKTIAVTYGFGGKNMHASGADFVIDELKELLPLIQTPFFCPRK